LASLNLIRWIRPASAYGDEGCTNKCCLPKLKQFVWVVLVLTVLAFITMIVFIMADIGTTPAGGGVTISAEQQIAEFAWFSFYVTFVFVEVVWFLLLSVCGICSAGLDLFTPSEEGNNDQSGMNCAFLVSMLTCVLVSIAQITLLVRVFLWRPFPGVEWDLPTTAGVTLLLDFVPAIILIVCCLLSPYRKGTLFTEEL